MPSPPSHYSPLRYPGGKSWLAPELRRWLAQEKRVELIELFAGGSYASLLAVMEGYVEKATLVELDPAICAVWRTIFSDRAEELCRRIRAFCFNEERVQDLLSRSPRSDLGVAFHTIVKNRARRGGILAAGAGILRSGERNKGLSSRWYPNTLATRIETLHRFSDRFTVIEDDAFSVLKMANRRRNPVKLFVDPPYTRLSLPGVKPLYKFNNINHSKLFHLLSRSPHDFLLTYDDSELVQAEISKHALSIQRIPMRTTHAVNKFELLITGRNSDILVQKQRKLLR